MIPKSAKIVVIGGGVFGTSAAFRLADAGHRDVVLLDRGPIASGTTPFAAGQTGYLNSDRFSLEFGCYNIEFFENFEQHTGQPIDFHQCGSLRVALTERYQTNLESQVETATELGHDVQLISHDRATELVPTFSPPAGCRVLWIPRDGYVEPKSVAVAYAAAARERGVEICTRVAVSGIQTEGGRVRAVSTSAGTIETEWVVLAAGAWTRQFCHGLGLNLPAVPVRHQAFVTAPLAGVLAEQPIVRITEPQIYVRHEARGLMVGGYGYRPISFDMDEFPDDFEIAALESDLVYFERLRAAATEFFPGLEKAVIVQERRGLPTISPDGRLIVSEPGGFNGLVIVSACGVGGISASPGVGRLVAEIVSGETPWIDPDLVSAGRFGGKFSEDAKLRARCEEVYAHHYHDNY
jgi:sarcosine dehydrogenase|tara:strand:+ start:339 stop:1562 length:1224 start_codon:yes stop_codon:yes gene_type:complete